MASSWGKSKFRRFENLPKELQPIPDEADCDSKGVKKPPPPPAPVEEKPLCQNMKPMRNPKIKLGPPPRSSSTPTLPTIRGAYKFSAAAQVMVGANPAQLEGQRPLQEEYEVPGKMGKSEGKIHV